jgi:hypothetical protein
MCQAQLGDFIQSGAAKALLKLTAAAPDTVQGAAGGLSGIAGIRAELMLRGLALGAH